MNPIRECWQPVCVENACVAQYEYSFEDNEFIPVFFILVPLQKLPKLQRHLPCLQHSLQN